MTGEVRRVPSPAAVEYYSGARDLRLALMAGSESAVKAVVKQLVEETSEVHSGVTDIKDDEQVARAFQASRKAEFILATPISEHCLNFVIEGWSESCLGDGELIRISNPWLRLGELEKRQVTHGEKAVGRAFLDGSIPELMRPIFYAYGLVFSQESHLLANYHDKPIRIDPQIVLRSAISEGMKKVNRFGELTSRMTVRYGVHDSTSQGGSEHRVFKRSTFMRDSALQSPTVVLACQRVLAGCESGCYSPDPQVVMNGHHGYAFQTAIENYQRLSRRELKTRVDTYMPTHYRDVPYDPSAWELAGRSSQELELRPAVDLGKSVDPYTGRLITDIALDPKTVIGCAAIPFGLFDRFLDMHADMFLHSRLWVDISREYREMNQGRTPLKIDFERYQQRNPLPFSNFTQSASHDEIDRPFADAPNLST